MPAPVSPVATVNPGPKERSSLSISTTSRIERAVNMGPDPVAPALEQRPERAGEEPLFLLRPGRSGLGALYQPVVQQLIVAVLVP